jgi:hypothetical protein
VLRFCPEIAAFLQQTPFNQFTASNQLFCGAFVK